MIAVLPDLVIAEFLCIEADDERLGGILGEGFAGEILIFAIFIGDGIHREEKIVRLGAPRACRELVLFGKLRGRRTHDAERLAWEGIGPGEERSPFFVVVAGAAEDAEGAGEATGEIVVPFPVVHELAVLQWVFLAKQCHGRAAPDLADAAAGVAVEHEGGGVEAGHRADVAGFRVDGFFAVRCERGGGGHGEGKVAVFAVIDEGSLRPVIAVWVDSAPGVAEKVGERALEQAVVDVRAALFRK